LTDKKPDESRTPDDFLRWKARDVLDSDSAHPLVYELKQAAVKLGKSERWLADKLRDGRFPGRKIGRTWKLTSDDLDEILRLCAVRAESVGPTGAAIPGASQSSSMTRTTARRMESVAKRSRRFEDTS
jgi:hypothetical protein